MRTPAKDNSGKMAEGELKEMMGQLLQEVKEIRRENREFREEIVRLREQNEKIEGELKDMKLRVEKVELMEDRMEKLDRANRRDNIIINGIILKGNNNVDMTRELERFLYDNLQVQTEIKEVHRINQRLWMARVGSFEGKIEIMKNKYKLKNGDNKKIYINSDLTEQERKIQKRLGEMADEKRKEGKRVKVGYQRLTMDGKKWMWNVHTHELEVGKQFDLPKNGTK